MEKLRAAAAAEDATRKSDVQKEEAVSWCDAAAAVPFLGRVEAGGTSGRGKDENQSRAS